MSIIKIGDIDGNIEDLVTRVQAGETIVIEKDGQPVARLAPVDGQQHRSKTKIDITALQAFTRSLPPARETAAEIIRQQRDESY